MKPLRNAALLAALIALISFSALAQNMSQSPRCVDDRSGGSLVEPRGAPYAAQIVSATDQTLTNGTHIHRETKTKLYRDSQGRTRREMFSMQPEQPDVISSIDIRDPVACSAYTLFPLNQTARRIPSHVEQPLDPQTAAKIQHAAESAPRPPEYVRPQETRENLGTQMIDGISTQGMRITMTFPAGARGNDHPIITVTEIWHSNELGLALLTKRTDVQFGDTTTHVRILDRSEPDPSLFQLPAGYTLLNPESH